MPGWRLRGADPDARRGWLVCDHVLRQLRARATMTVCARCERAIPAGAPRHYMCDQVFCTVVCRVLSAADVLTERAEQLYAARASADERKCHEQRGASRLHAAGPIGPALAQVCEHQRPDRE